MSANESALLPLISLQTDYVPGPMVYHDWTFLDSGTQRHPINAPESFVDIQPFQSQHCVLHGDTHTPVLGHGTTQIIASGPEGELEIESDVSSSNSISSRSLVVSSAPDHRHR